MAPMRKKAAERMTSLIACDECDLVQRSIPLPAGGWALCRRCEGPLYHHTPGGLDRALAFTLGALVLFLVANFFPIIELEVQEHVSSSSLSGAVQRLWSQDMGILAALLAATTIVLPALELSIMLHILLPLRFGRVPAGMPMLLRGLQAVRPWSMMEIFLLGVLVAIVKLAHLAHIVTGIALWSFGGMMLLRTAAATSFNLRELWEHVALP